MDHEELVAYLSVLVREESFHENSIISLAVCACVCVCGGGGGETKVSIHNKDHQCQSI